MSTSITTPLEFHPGTVIIVDTEWMRVTGTVPNCGLFTSTVVPVGRMVRWRLQARGVLRRGWWLWRRKAWWPVVDWLVEQHERRRR